MYELNNNFLGIKLFFILQVRIRLNSILVRILFQLVPGRREKVLVLKSSGLRRCVPFNNLIL